MTNIEAAAERLRKAADDLLNSQSIPFGGDAQNFRLVPCEKSRELRAALIASRPPDDSETVTEEWLRSVGFEDNELLHIKSRGQFRRLCSALGIALMEGSSV